MTTIAFKNGVLAGDRLVCEGGTRYGSISKVAAAKDANGHDVLVAASGAGALAQRWLRWAVCEMPKGEPPPPLQVDDAKAYGFIFYADGRLVSHDPGMPPMTTEMMREGGLHVAAFGLGGELALGAMAAGASPQWAIEIASRFDTSTSDAVDVVAFTG